MRARISSSSFHGTLELELDASADALARAGSRLLAVLLATVFILMFVGLFSSVRPTVQFGTAWFVTYGTCLFVLLLSAGVVLRRRHARFRARSRLRAAGYLLAAALGVAMFSAEAIFSGLPILLHYATSRDGTMVVTVTGKEYGYRRGTCSPRLIVKEFTFFGSDHVCFDKEILDRIEVGQHVLLTGQVSPFGIQATGISWHPVTPTPVHPAQVAEPATESGN
jgi:hypothetical protein